ncbi:hypothetical protein M0802_004338 [Mischocyttarus mexicanus]|nr:hypothetical protein M0802_004338 [Mischocyttarus mexicanus]
MGSAWAELRKSKQPTNQPTNPQRKPFHFRVLQPRTRKRVVHLNYIPPSSVVFSCGLRPLLGMPPSTAVGVATAAANGGGWFGRENIKV